MCRWLAYSGGPISLDEVIFKTEHSIIDQSLHSEMGATTTNGDGFGIGWYGRLEKPGLYKGTHPAWNDDNLKNLTEQIESHLFMAHIRATTGTPVQRSNCHPFQHENWIFVHNGAIRGFHKIRRELLLAVSPELFPEIAGSTDSELMFYLALTFGMKKDVKKGISKMVAFVERVGYANGVEYPIQMSLGISDGQAIYGFRYSSEGDSRSLYHSVSIESMKDIAPNIERFREDSRALVSEPLSHQEELWVPIPESSFVTIKDGDVTIEEFMVADHVTV